MREPFATPSANGAERSLAAAVAHLAAGDARAALQGASRPVLSRFETMRALLLRCHGSERAAWCNYGDEASPLRPVELRASASVIYLTFARPEPR